MVKDAGIQLRKESGNTATQQSGKKAAFRGFREQSILDVEERTKQEAKTKKGGGKGGEKEKGRNEI